MYLNLFFILIFVFLSSCSTFNPFKDNKFYYKNGYQRVQLDVENNNTKNIHPIKISPLKIQGALKLIITKYGPKSEPLFQKEKYLPYSVAISEALAEAKKNQDVVFTVEGWYRKKTLSENRVTSGRVFYNKNGLNVIFGSIMRKGNISDTDPMISSGLNPDLATNPYVPGSRYQTVKSEYYLSTIPNSGVFRPKEAKGRADWLVFTNKALQARDDLTADQRKFATGANIQVQGLRDEVQQLRRELQSIRNPGQPGSYGYPQYQYGAIPPYQQPAYPPQQGGYPYYPPQSSPYGYPAPPQQYYPVQKPATNNFTLKSLEKMRERGLISEENYLKKLKEFGY
ncbi:MAG: hypothetical protein CMP38_06360 [Rickettsiales bacterium]|nr:hypothetical protein [Rickettsiales bacterium]|tara:strand:- start:1758 stop:2777 length:1020 start_codon:yes stop_codon:yes gene_type:complete